MHRFTQKFLPESFDEVRVRNAVRNIGGNEIQLRNADQLQIVGSTSSLVLPLFDFPKIWQTFPDEQIKFVRKISEFDAKKKKFSMICLKLLYATDYSARPALQVN